MKDRRESQSEVTQLCPTIFKKENVISGFNDSEKFTKTIIDYWVWGFPGGFDGKVSARNVGDLGSIPGSGGSPEEGNGNPLQ